MLHFVGSGSGQHPRRRKLPALQRAKHCIRPRQVLFKGGTILFLTLWKILRPRGDQQLPPAELLVSPAVSRAGCVPGARPQQLLPVALTSAAALSSRLNFHQF